MTATLTKKVLELLRLFEVNDAYVAPLNADLEEINTGFQAIDRIADRSSRVLDALGEDKLEEAVRELLEYLEIDDELEQLNSIKTGIAQGGELTDAVQAAQAPRLVGEIVESSGRVLGEAAGQLEELQGSLDTLTRNTLSKISGVRQAWGEWSWAERFGTPEALEGVRERAQAAEASAQSAKQKLEALRRAADELRVAHG